MFFYGGNFIGPTLSGLLVEEIGFRNTAMVFSELFLIMAILNTLDALLIYMRMAKKKNAAVAAVLCDSRM